MKNSIITFVKNNKKQIIKKGIVVVGSAVGFVLVNGLIKMGTPSDEDLELYEGEAEDFENDNDELEETNE